MVQNDPLSQADSQPGGGASENIAQQDNTQMAPEEVRENSKPLAKSEDAEQVGVWGPMGTLKSVGCSSFHMCGATLLYKRYQAL